MTLSLGIDIGTSGVRTAVIEADGSLVSMARAAHLPQAPDMIDAAKWWDAVEMCLHKQMSALREVGRDPHDISGIAIDGTSGSMVLTDAALAPVSPALMYNSKGFDSEAQKIAGLAPDPHITRGANSALARAMRLVSKATEEPVYLLHQADFITAKLLGKGGHSDQNNALKTGFDPESESWPDWIGKVIAPDLLPEVHAVGTPLGPVSPHMATRFGLTEATLIHAGTTDSIAAFLACAALEPGIAVTSLGSTLAIKILSRARIEDPNIGLYSHRIGDMWLVGGASNTGGAVLASYFSGDEIARLSRKMNPETPTGLGYYPLKELGERFPINDSNLEPLVTPRPANDAIFLQGLFEGIADIERRCYAAIVERGGDAPNIVLSAGGGAQNPIYTQIRQNALNIDISTPTSTEAAIGAAKLTQLNR